MKRSDTHYNRSTTLFPWAVLAVSLAVTLGATAFVAHSVNVREDVQFVAARQKAENHFRNRISSMAALLKGVKGMFYGQHDGSLSEFHNFAEGVDFDKHFAGMKGIGYALNMQQKSEAALRDRLKLEGIEKFAEHPKGQWPRYPILYFEPSKAHVNMLGFILASDPALREAMDRSTSTGELAVSRLTELESDPALDDKKAFFMFVPVYFNNDSVKTEAQRMHNSIGFVFAPVLPDELMDPQFTEGVAMQVTLAGSGATIYQSHEYKSLPHDYQPRSSVHIPENIDGQDFNFYLSSTPEFDQASDRWFIPLTLVVGIMVSSLLFLFTNMEANARKRAQKEADERKIAQRELAVSRDRLRNLIEQAPLSIQVINPEGKTIEVNSGFEKLFGMHLPDVQKLNLLEHPYIAESGLLPYFLRAISGKPTLFPPTLFDPQQLGGSGAKRWIAGSAYPLTDEQGRVREIVIMHQDLTELKHKEEEITRINAHLEQRVEERTEELAGAMSEMEAFSYSVAHDLRAPLRAMGSFAKILCEDYSEKLDEEARSFLDRIVENSIRMGDLIDGLLDLSRISRATLAKDEVDLSGMANEIMRSIEKRQTSPWARTRVQQGLHVEADSRLIHSALENLLDNAWKFSHKSKDPLIEFGADDQDGERVYYVKDNGAGFDPSYMNKLFKPFERLHTGTEFPGTGIGLATVRRIIERHGGKVWAEGSLNGGATFFFTLPPGGMKTSPPLDRDMPFDWGDGETAFSASRGRLA